MSAHLARRELSLFYSPHPTESYPSPYFEPSSSQPMATLLLWRRDTIVGASPPPPGVTPDFENPPNKAYAIIIPNIVLAIISTVSVFMRLYTAWFITHQRGMTDYLLAISWIFALIFSITLFFTTQYGFGRHLWDIPFSVFNVNCLKIGAINGVFYGMSIMLTKLSILAFYLRFILPGKLRAVISSVMVLTIVYSIISSFEWVYACQPLEKYWDLTITDGVCIDWVKLSVFNAVMNSVTDAVILLLPFFILHGLVLPMPQKIGVMIVMMTGGFILIISLIKAKTTVDLLQSTDITWEIIPTAILGSFEVHIAIVCACMPFAKPFLRRYFPRVFGSSSSSCNARPLQTIYSTANSHPLPSREGDEASLSSHEGVA
ncbi:hypothetical protein EDB81DRAFT_771772 [Dactylonectria macrodidyma]|uniref:Rhodopsin domain-containing protein n=1 Tax=Dactylonectria macrodidyma TaxID=307937 RepID=A0A9P9FTP8_9HYPO|nr:hypothetical protein EDB81DRAFT_771772 [Dactylonectria macrodidyma]